MAGEEPKICFRFLQGPLWWEGRSWRRRRSRGYADDRLDRTGKGRRTSCASGRQVVGASRYHFTVLVWMLDTQQVFSSFSPGQNWSRNKITFCTSVLNIWRKFIYWLNQNYSLHKKLISGIEDGFGLCCRMSWRWVSSLFILEFVVSYQYFELSEDLWCFPIVYL